MDATAVQQILKPKRHWWVEISVVGRRKPLGTASAFVIAALIMTALLANIIAPYNPARTNTKALLTPPSSQYLMGTDHIGRDIFSNIVHGARLSLLIGFMSVLAGTASGSLLGIVSGYFAGKTDFWLQRFVDTLMSFPTLILAIAIVALFGNNLINVVMAIAITVIPGTSRVIRGAVLSVKENQFVEAARAIGCNNIQIMARHILPNVVAPIIILASITLGNAILAEASLSFLGLGVPPPAASWGRMLGGDSIRFMVDAPWLLIFPGIAIALVVLAVNLLGDAIRDVLDPRLRGT